MQTEKTKKSSRKIIFLILAIACSLSSGLLQLYQPDQYSSFKYTAIRMLWCIAGALMILGNLEKREITFKNWFRKYSHEIFILVLIIAFAACLRLFLLGSIPRILNGDDGWTALTANRTIYADFKSAFNPFTSDQGFGRVYFDLINLPLNVFGNTKFAVRLIPALGGILAIPAIYILARYMLGVRGAIIAAFLLAVSHTHIHFSRSAAVGYIQGTWLAPLELYFFLSGLMKKSKLRMIIGGLLLGVHFNFYYGAQVLTGFLSVFILICALFKRELIIGNMKNILMFFTSAILLAFPHLLWLIMHPQFYFARFAMEGTFSSGWLQNEITLYGRNVFEIFWERITHTFLSIFYHNFQDFYWAPAPVLTVITSGLFLLGLIIATVKMKKTTNLFLNGWVWSGIISIAIFAIPASADSYRLLMILPALIIFSSLGLITLMDTKILKRYIFGRRFLLIAPVLFAIAVINIKIYYIDFAGNCLYGGNTRARGLSLIGDYLKMDTTAEHIYFLGMENFQPEFAHALNYLKSGQNIITILDPFDANEISQKGNLRFLVAPSREGELSRLARALPDGEVKYITDCDNLSFIVYSVLKL